MSTNASFGNVCYRYAVLSYIAMKRQGILIKRVAKAPSKQHLEVISVNKTLTKREKHRSPKIVATVH